MTPHDTAHAGPVPAAEERQRAPAPKPAGAAGPAVAPSSAVHVLALQTVAGNAAVTGFLQRDAAELTSVADVMGRYATAYLSPRAYLSVDDEGLGRHLADRLLAGKDIGLAHQVLDALMTSDRDDVAEALCVRAAGRLGDLDAGMRIRLIREMLDTVVDKGAERQVTDLWLSFGGGLGTVIAEQKALWKLSLAECEPLTERFAEDIRAFGTDIMDAARAYLQENRRLTQEEGGSVGLDLGGGVAAKPAAEVDSYVDEMLKAAKIAAQLETLSKELAEVAVGYDMSQALMVAVGNRHPGDEAGAYKELQAPPKELLVQHGTVATFSPTTKPSYAPTGQDPVDMAPYTEVAGHHQALAGQIAAYARAYPSIHAAMTQGRLQDLGTTTDASKARKEVEATLRGTLRAIGDSEKALGSGITQYDLVPIQQQLLTGTLQKPATSTRAWDTPLYSALARDDLDKKKARDFWVDLGLGMASAFALIAAPFTGGLSAAVLVGAGIGISAGMAAASWDKYLNLRPLENAAIKDELQLVQKGAVDGALLEAVVASVGVFLDAMAVGGAIKQARSATRSAARAELHGSIEAQEAAAQARMAVTKGARNDLGGAVAGAGVAVGAHELADEEPVEPALEVTGGGIAFAVPAEATPPVTVSELRVQRTPQQLRSAESAMAAIDAGPMPRHWGDRFELSVLASTLRGEVAGMEGVTYAFRAQHRSGQGIDIIAFGTGPDGRFKIWQIECKWTEGGPYLAKLGSRGGAIQTSEAWTHANMVEWFKVAPAAEKSQLLRAVKAANGGRAVSEAHLATLIAKADVIIAGPLGTGAAGMMRRIWGQMSALSRAGRVISYREFRPH
ncbi:hypothetical protein ACWFNE_00590 [Cellulomonas sp. NPDC055163]